MRWIYRTQSSFSENFFPVFNWRYFLFHHSRLGASKYHFENSTRTALSKGFLRGKLKLCEVNSQNKKPFLRQLLSIFSLKILPFSPEPSMGFQISLCKFHKNSLSERLLEGKAVTLWDELTEHKAVYQKASFQFLTEDISFFTIALYGLPNIPLPIPQEQP